MNHPSSQFYLLSIGCADARVPPNVIMGEEAGNVFVHRNVANMVVNTDTNLLSALQYGVAYLKVKHIIICGHYECGGVRAAEANQDFIAPLEMWLRNIRDVYAKHAKELDAISDANKRHRRLVDLNVVQQAINVMKTGVVQQRRAETYQEGEPYTAPLVHAMVFDPTTGDLKRLEIDFSKWENELTSVYGLHMVS
jgi:carbonic anhydrase